MGVYFKHIPGGVEGFEIYWCRGSQPRADDLPLGIATTRGPRFLVAHGSYGGLPQRQTSPPGLSLTPPRQCWYCSDLYTTESGLYTQASSWCREGLQTYLPT